MNPCPLRRRAGREQLVQFHSHNNGSGQGQNRAVAGFCVPSSLDTGPGPVTNDNLPKTKMSLVTFGSGLEPFRICRAYHTRICTKTR